MPTNPCCDCMSLGTGVLIIGLYQSIGSAFSVLFDIYLLSEFQKGSDGADLFLEMLGPSVVDREFAVLSFLILFYIYETIDGILLVMGANQKNATLCLIGMVLLIISSVTYLAFSLFLVAGKPLTILGVFLLILYRSYFVWVIYAFKAQLDQGGQDNAVRNQPTNPNFTNNQNDNYNIAQSGPTPYYYRNQARNEDYPLTPPPSADKGS